MAEPINLKGLLRQWAIPQAELAAGVGVSRATISLIVSKNHWPKMPDPPRLQFLIESWLYDRLAERGIHPGSAVKQGLWAPAGTGTHSNLNDRSPEVNVSGERPIMEIDTMLTHAEWLTDGAKRFFSLPKDPFRDDVETPEDVFLSAEHGYALECMSDALGGHRIVAVIGESGSGKTTIRRLFAERHADTKRWALITPYMLGADEAGGKEAKPLRGWDIQEAIITTLDPQGKVPQSRQARARRVDSLLRRSLEAGRRNVVVIDQAHKLPTRTLVFLKELHDLEMGMRRLTGVVLIAQPEIESKLDIRTQSGWEAREFIQRCEKAHLRSLDAGNDLEAYLDIKFRRVRAEPERILERDVPDAIRGVLQVRTQSGSAVNSYVYPLAINNLMTRALNLTARIGKPDHKVAGAQIRAALGG